MKKLFVFTIASLVVANSELIAALPAGCLFYVDSQGNETEITIDQTISGLEVEAGNTRTFLFKVKDCQDNLHAPNVNILRESGSPTGNWTLIPEIQLFDPPFDIAAGGEWTFAVSLMADPCIQDEEDYQFSFEIRMEHATGTSSSVIVTLEAKGRIYANLAITEPIRSFGQKVIPFMVDPPEQLGIINNGDSITKVRLQSDGSPAWSNYSISVTGITGEIDGPNQTLDFILPGAEGICLNGPPPSMDISYEPSTDGNHNVGLLVIEQWDNDPDFDAASIFVQGSAAIRPTDFVLLLDCSGSMGSNSGSVNPLTGQDLSKLEVLRDAGNTFADMLNVYATENSNYEFSLGMVEYNQNNDIILNLADVTASGTLSDAETALDGLRPGGSTCIADGMKTASSHLMGYQSTDRNKIMVVLTDGVETPGSCSWSVDFINGAVFDPALPEYQHPSKDILYFAVGIGDGAPNLSTTIIDDIVGFGDPRASNISPANYFPNMGDANFSDLSDFFIEVFEKATGRQGSPTVYARGLNETLEVPFNIVSSDNDAVLSFIGQYPEEFYEIQVVDPIGNVIAGPGVLDGISIGVNRRKQWALMVLDFEDASRDYTGTWIFKARLKSDILKQRLSQAEIDRTHYMNFSASVKSDFRLFPGPLPSVNVLGQPLMLSAKLAERSWASLNGNVVATVTAPDGGTSHIALFDDGLHHDGLPNDGRYGNAFTQTQTKGQYQVEIRSSSHNKKGERVERYNNQLVFIGERSAPPKDDQSGRLKYLIILIWVVIVLLVILIIKARRST